MQSALKKKTSLALVPLTNPSTEADEFALSSYVLHSSFSTPSISALAPRTLRFAKGLTTEDFVQVELATVREGRTHRYWPAEVIEKFAAADVITRGQ